MQPSSSTHALRMSFLLIILVFVFTPLTMAAPRAGAAGDNSVSLAQLYHSAPPMRPGAEQVPELAKTFLSPIATPDSAVEIYMLAADGDLAQATIVYSDGTSSNTTPMSIVGTASIAFHGAPAHSYAIWGGSIPAYPLGTTIAYHIVVADGLAQAVLAQLGGITNPLGQPIRTANDVGFDYGYTVVERRYSTGLLERGFPLVGPPNAGINAMALQPDGKIIVGGNFTLLGSRTRHGLARLDPDGSLDPSFDPGRRAGEGGKPLALQPDGKIVVYTGWSAEGGLVVIHHIARLNADGSRDATFNPGSGFDSRVYALALQPDAKVLVGGDFSTIDGVPRNGLARLNSDGSLDVSFNPTFVSIGRIYVVAVQPDGKILIGGSLSYVTDDQEHRNIARLNPDGSLDTSFNPGDGPNGPVRTLVLQPDGQILIGGGWNSVDGVPRNLLARLQTDGRLVAGFAPDTGPGLFLDDMVLQPDGKVVIVGRFSLVSGEQMAQVARLNANGSLDVTFAVVKLVDYADIRVLALQPDGDLLIGGVCVTINGVPCANVARLTSPADLRRAWLPLAPFDPLP